MILAKMVTNNNVNHELVTDVAMTVSRLTAQTASPLAEGNCDGNNVALVAVPHKPLPCEVPAQESEDHEDQSFHELHQLSAGGSSYAGGSS